MAIQFETYFNKSRSRRYQLARGDAKKALCFVMLNPSNADHENDDPTIRRCLGFMNSLGYSGLIVVNLCSLITPAPRILYAHIGAKNRLKRDELNDAHIKYSFQISRAIVAAYGAFKHPALQNKAGEIFKWTTKPIYALKLTKGGFPCHPLRLRKNCKLIPFNQPQHQAGEGH